SATRRPLKNGLGADQRVSRQGRSEYRQREAQGASRLGKQSFQRGGDGFRKLADYRELRWGGRQGRNRMCRTCA
ncbi:hypothetical protein FRC01_002834, partial [Tulasnella sp. 417]